MPDIRKRSGKKGSIYQVRYEDKSSATGYSYQSFALRKEAQSFIENLSTLKHLNKQLNSMAAAADTWLTICETEGRDGRKPVSKAVIKLYERRAQIIKSYAWEKTLQEITKPDVVAFRSWLLNRYSRDQSRKVLSSLHSVMLEMISRGHVGHDPAMGVRIQSEAPKIEIPSQQQVRKILQAADALSESPHAQIREAWKRYRPMIYLAVASGMRPQEYVALPRRDVLKNGIRVSQAMDRSGKIGEPKSRAGYRTIDVGQEVIQMIQDFMGDEGTPDDLVFGTRTGKPMQLVPFRASAWAPLMKQAGLMTKDTESGEVHPKYTPYALRHFFASSLLMKNCDIKYVQSQMGHARASITLDTYGHLIPTKDDTRTAATRGLVGELLSV
ncbi:tyrosine-type recombinase/integrase [Pseudomonas plecoglossicida]|uniref:Site-specific integrase n=1 Tax=Pseudomonas plecoglossicida TaxID=70775 RepID=A0AAD0VV89_PSEDL|nr:site-specific integrase [Pseudomonas plecoglossicida]AXM98010.1 site-specific integrase [Pseudomonas plecoglossicida]QLB54148.1 site-specific integrase [Pseudomonas plecoglossicida]GLR38458.1 site-specific integrase [Pseudomonas plecoglossicida]